MCALLAVSRFGYRDTALTDGELVARFQRGDRSAFDALLHRYQDRVYTLCHRWIGEPATAEETAQDVFLAVFRGLGGFRGDARLSTWIFQVTLNHCRNRRQYRARRGWGRTESLGPRVQGEGPERQFTAEGAEADQATATREAQLLVGEALNALEPEQRQILLLRDVEDLSYEEIATILGVPRGTVKSRIHRARSELAEQLGRKIGATERR